MLELRPNCEWCGDDLPPNDLRARICSYECTYCADCVEKHLKNVCPTCGGELVRRPVRPAREWRPNSGLGLKFHPASEQRRKSNWSAADLALMVERVGLLPPKDR